jgi:hypothetical protein
MELVLDLGAQGAKQTGGNSGDAERGGLPSNVRLALAAGAVAAAWAVMADTWVAELVTRVMSDVIDGVIPGPIGTMLASLPGI